MTGPSARTAIEWPGPGVNTWVDDTMDVEIQFRFKNSISFFFQTVNAFRIPSEA